MRTAICVCLATAMAVAQETSADKAPTAKHFLFSGYENTMHIDLKRMREREVWDELQVSALKLVLSMVEKESGFALDDVDRFTLATRVPKDSKDFVRDAVEVFVTEGNRPLQLPPRVNSRIWEDREVGGKQVRYRERFETGRIFYVPHPHVHVEGSLTLLQPILEKSGHVGLPAADVMSMLSGREDRLAYTVGTMAHPNVRKQFGQLLNEPAWPAGDEPTFFGVQVLVAGDEDDPHLVVEMALRHARAGDGLEVSRKAAEQRVAELAKDRRFLSLRKVLRAAEFATDGTDLVMRMDLGRVRNAVGQLAALLMPLMMPTAADAAPQGR